MKTRISKGKWVLIALALLTAMFIAACGGGGGSAGGGIGGTGKAVGAIDGFGSIFVNGVEFHTGSAAISIDDSPGTEGELKLGMVVVVEGEFSADGISGVAGTVIFEDVVEGTMTTGVDTATKSFDVMGQTVFYTAATVFEESGGGDILPTALSRGNIVEVSGVFDSAGQIRASRVERKALSHTGEVLEVKGMVNNLDTTQRTFTIGALDINYFASTTVFDNGNMSDLANSVLVEVKGSNDVLNDLFLDADKIEFKFEDFGNNGDLLEFEGVVNSVSSSTGYDFEVNGLPVLTDGNTQWRNGYMSLADVVVDDEVEVEGTLQDQGGTLVLVAREVELEIEDDVRIEGLVQAVNSAADMLSILDITVEYSGSEFEDKNDVNTSADQLTAGDWVRVEATLDSGGNVIATRIEQDNDDERLDEIILEGPATLNLGPTPGDFTILGVTIARTVGVQYEIEDVPVTETVFFNNLTDGRFVKARGSFSGGTLNAEELDLQN